MSIGRNREVRHLGMVCGLAFVLLVTAAAVAAQSGSFRAGGRQTPDVRTTKTPVLLLHESVDVNGDGVTDSVSYFSSRADRAFDAESVDFGSTGRISRLALRCDFDEDGKDDDWMIVDPDTEEVKAVLLDKDDDGEADLVDLGHGHTEPFHGRGPHMPAGATR